MTAAGPQSTAGEGGQGCLTVYYDGSCPLCTTEIGHYRRVDRDGAVVFADVSEPGCVPAPDLDRERAMARFHVRTAEGRLLSGAAAFAALWRTLPGPWRLAGHVAGWRPVTAMLELGYRAVLPVRPRLSRLAGRFRRRADPAPSGSGTPAGRNSG